MDIQAEFTAADLTRRLAKVQATEGALRDVHRQLAQSFFEELAGQLGYRVERIQPEEASQAAWEARCEANPAFTRAAND
jgi:fido (protein-threonine AMPylation protein)